MTFIFMLLLFYQQAFANEKITLNEKIVNKIEKNDKLNIYKKDVVAHVNSIKKVEELDKILGSTEVNKYVNILEKQVEKAKTLQEMDMITLNHLLSLGMFVEVKKEKEEQSSNK